MPLPVGSRLGSHEIVAKIGEGGMGEVYRARDTRLNRDVAIKVLPEVFARDEDRLARFTREAQTLAALNHPNIAQIYGLEKTDTTPDVLIMELVEGEDLSARVQRGPMALDEAVAIATQIAEALEAAHERGIIHRDLKPANVKVRADGVVKVLDFGLAKAFSPDSAEAPPSGSPTVTSPAMTALGLILGTAAYMSPEQAKGRAVDKRADIWAFGVVLFEMLAGRPLFHGDSVVETLGFVATRDPDWTSLPDTTPPAIRRLLARCLTRDPKLRLRDIGEVRIALQDPAALERAPADAASGTGALTPRSSPAAWVAIAAATLVLGAAAAWYFKPAPAVSPGVTSRFAHDLPKDRNFTRTGRRFVAVSPDGRRLAYIANRQIFVREMHETSDRPLKGTDDDPVDLTFSPDGRSIAYFAPRTSGLSGAVTGSSLFTLKRVPIDGGASTRLCEADWPFGVRWRGQALVFGQNGEGGHGIWTVAETGGTASMIAAVEPTEQVTRPELTDDGRAVIFAVKKNADAWDESSIVMHEIASGNRTVLVKGGTDGRIIGADRLLFYRAGSLFGIEFDAGGRRTRGNAVPLIDGVQATSQGIGAGAFDVSDNGTLIFVPGTGAQAPEPRQLVWVDRGGRESVIAAPPQQYRQPKLSPDGRKIAVVVQSGPTSKIVVWDMDRQIISPVTNGYSDLTPLWTPDNRQIIYRSATADGLATIMRADAGGAGTPETLYTLSVATRRGGFGYLDSLSPDGQTVIFRDGADNSDLKAFTIGTPAPAVVFAGPGQDIQGKISPDGKWIVYGVSGQGTAPQAIFMHPYPAVASGRWPVSPPDAASDPLWARSGRELFYLSTTGSKLMSVTVRPGPVLGRPTEVLDVSAYRPWGDNGTDYDVSLDDGRFLMITRPPAGTAFVPAATITIVTHWTDDLAARVK